MQKGLKFILLLLLTFLLAAYTKAQELEDDEIVAAKAKLVVNQFTKDGVDSVFVYQSNFIGSNKIVDVPNGATDIVIDSLFCESKEAGYVFAIADGKVIIQKIHPCFNFETIIINNSNVLSFLKSNPKIVEGTELKPFECRYEGQIVDVVSPHGEVRILTMKLPAINMDIHLHMNNLNYKISGCKNINYAFNRRNLAYRFTEAIEEQIQALAFKKAK